MRDVFPVCAWCVLDVSGRSVVMCTQRPFQKSVTWFCHWVATGPQGCFCNGGVGCQMLPSLSLPNPLGHSEGLSVCYWGARVTASGFEKFPLPWHLGLRPRCSLSTRSSEGQPASADRGGRGTTRGLSPPPGSGDWQGRWRHHGPRQTCPGLPSGRTTGERLLPLSRSVPCLGFFLSW